MSDQIRSIYSRWERLEEEKAATSADLKELFIEAKANGYDAKALRAAFRLRSMSSDEGVKQSEHEALVDLYLAGLNGTEDAPRAHPRIARNEPPLEPDLGPTTPPPAVGAKTVPAPIRAGSHDASDQCAEGPDKPKALDAQGTAAAVASAAAPIQRDVRDDDLDLPPNLRRERNANDDAAVAAIMQGRR